MGDISINVGGGFTGLLAVAFITLKLLGKIDWSWWWVLAPLWIPFGIVVAVILIMLLFILIILIITAIVDKLFIRRK